MKRLAFALAATLYCVSFSASADDTQGKVTAVNQDNMTITLSDGSTYKLPPEMDVSDIQNGVEVVIAYRLDEKGAKQITDMFIPD